MDRKHKYQLTLSGTDNTVPALQRLRSALKVLLRVFGLRCVHVREIAEEPKRSKHE